MSDYNKTLINVKDLKREPGATGILSDYKDHTDPKYIGPGTWNVTHRSAFKARTHAEQLSFIVFMKETCYGFPCVVCKSHCTEHIKNHPIEDYLDVLVDINGQRLPLGLFVWTWKFHNAVNARLKKPIMNWNTAYNLYSNSEILVCGKNCMGSEDLPPDGSENLTRISPQVPQIPEFKITTSSIYSSMSHILSTQIPSQPFRLISTNKNNMK